MCLRVRVRKFFCDDPFCKQDIRRKFWLLLCVSMVEKGR